MDVRTISLHVPDDLLESSGRYSAALQLTRAASLKCRDADLRVNAEFAALDN